MKRIVSLLPSATDIVGTLGLEGWLVGVSHECDWPPSVRGLPRLTRSKVETSLPPGQIEALVNQSIHAHHSLYDLDVEQLRALRPDVILTQELCDVCAVSYDQVLGAARVLQGDGAEPTILSLEPTDLDSVIDTVEIVADALGETSRGVEVAGRLRERVATLRARGEAIEPKPSVLVLEWTDPPWIGGHWVPDMVAVAGGRNVPQQAMRRGQTSIRVTWREIEANEPDLIVVAPCGYNREGTARLVAELDAQPEWRALRAVRAERVYPMDANQFWSRPGPRLLEGIEELQEILAAGYPSWGGGHGNRG
jgi:iron complex transport system substrate-binding protein